MRTSRFCDLFCRMQNNAMQRIGLRPTADRPNR
jgi:hypothetical protein